MRKIWVALAALVVEGWVLVWVVGSQAWDWAAAVVVGR